MAGPTKEFEVHPYVQFMMDKYSPYKKWIESEGVPIIGGAFVQDVRTEKLEYWQRKDCKGAICTFSDQMVADAYIAEIDPGKSTKAATPALRRDHHRGGRPRRDDDLVRGHGEADLRMGARIDLRDPAQCVVPALQRQRHGALPLLRS